MAGKASLKLQLLDTNVLKQTYWSGNCCSCIQLAPMHTSAIHQVYAQGINTARSAASAGQEQGVPLLGKKKGLHMNEGPSKTGNLFPSGPYHYIQGQQNMNP